MELSEEPATELARLRRENADLIHDMQCVEVTNDRLKEEVEALTASLESIGNRVYDVLRREDCIPF